MKARSNGHSVTVKRNNKALQLQMQLLQKTVWQFLKKLNIELTYDPAIPLLDIFNRSKKKKT